MTRIQTLAGACVFALTGAACQAQPSGDEPVSAIIGATLIDGTGAAAIENGVILVEGDRIGCIGTAQDCPLPAGAVSIDLTGHYITPGLVDAHVHFAQTGWLDGRPDAFEVRDVYAYSDVVAELRSNPDRWHRAWLCSGITAVFDVGGADWTVTGEQSVDTARSDRAHVRAAGPLITHAGRNQAFMTGGAADQPLFLDMQSIEDVEADVARLVEIGADAVKVWYLAPREQDRERLDAVLMATGAAAREAGLPMIVHATSLREAKMALRAGAFMLVHSVSDQPVDAEFLDLLTESDAVYAPTLVVGNNWTRALASVVFEAAAPVDDPNGCVDDALLDRINHPERMTPGLPGRLNANWAYPALERGGAEMVIMQDNLMAVHAAGGRIATATDSGNPLTVHGASILWEMEAMQAAGLDPEAIITLSTRNGAQAMDGADEFGTLQAGLMADLVVLAEDPRADIAHYRSLTHVMRAGVLHSQAELRVRPAE
ncbi:MULTISPECIES: amidohydrolase family protein [Maricaulis]|uniref:Imidazolonepropionase-like amidohydrolase n=1 Tax=Maricaulis maris TaxID=74318 RepID=A0A495D346_9PROT|nr:MULTISPECIES: amidohydrolase family protein [Maricaulis]RKQ96195.1 imidazolonepropionase-like amidohydrolase [Maricaulis maris]